jgi:thioredoxin 1
VTEELVSGGVGFSSDSSSSLAACFRARPLAPERESEKASLPVFQFFNPSRYQCYQKSAISRAENRKIAILHPKRGWEMSELVKHLTDDSFESEVQKGITLVDFHASWCGPCRMLAPVLEQVAKEMKGKASIVKIDIDAEQKTAARFEILSVPTMILFKNGREVGRLVGLRNADAVKEFIETTA